MAAPQQVNDTGFTPAQAGASFNGNVQAQQGQPVMPERRRPVEAVDTSGIAQIAGSIANYVKGQQADAQKAAIAKAQGNFASTDLAIRFGAANGASAEQLASIATGYKQDTGTDLNAQQQAALKQYQGAVDAIKSASAQNPRFAQEQALLIARNRALQSNPELSKELLGISGTLNSVSSGFDSAAYAAAEAQQKRQQAAMDTLYSTVQSHGIDTSQMNDAQVRAYAQQNILPNQQALVAGKETWDAIQTQQNISNAQKSQWKDQILSQQGGALSQTVISGVRQAMDQAKASGASPQDIARAGNDALTQFQGKLMQDYQITNQADYDARLGWITNSLKGDIEQFSSGKLDADGLQNQVNMRLLAANQRLLNQVPGAAMTEVLNSKYGTLLQPFIATDPQGKASALLSNLLLQASQDKGGLSTRPPDITGGQGMNYPQSQVADDATKMGGIINTMYNRPEAATPEGKSASVKVAMSYLTDPAAMRTFEPIQNILPAIADDRWLALAKGQYIPHEALDNINSYLDAVNVRSQTLINKEGANLLPSVDQDGRLHLDTKNPSSNAAKLRTLETDINNAVRAYAHLNGSTDYRAVLGQLIAEQSGAPNAKAAADRDAQAQLRQR